MRPIRAIPALLASLLILAWGPARALQQDRASYETAVRESGLAMYFVRITLIDARTGAKRTGCTEVNFLRGALADELGVKLDRSGLARVQEKLLNSRQTVRLSNPAALARVALAERDETERLKAEMGLDSREAVLRKSEPDGEMMGFMLSGRDLPNRRRALACALISYGFTPRTAYEAGNVILFPK